MIFPTRIGVDSDGYILNKISINKIPNRYIEPVEFIKKILREVLGHNLHSIYIYGSVGRGNAIEGKSDIDFTVIVNNQPSDVENKNLEQGKELFLKTYNFIPKIDFAIALLDDVLSENNLIWLGILVEAYLFLHIWGKFS